MHPRILRNSFLWFAFSAVLFGAFAAGGNTIVRDSFNFGHQLGYMYSRTDSAYFAEPGTWSFTTGLAGYYTPEMPLVQDEFWKKRLILMVPLYFEFTPCSTVALQFEMTDLFVEYPYINRHNAGGKSPRFKTKVRLTKERALFPATALTLGVKWSSAKPYTMWEHRHNYTESNGLAGAGTGVADYLILFTVSKRTIWQSTLHARLGLAPVGSPMGVGKQADEIPYGISVATQLTERLSQQTEIAGMHNGLRRTILAHYAVVRTMLSYNAARNTVTINLEKGLTRSTDQWVGAVYFRTDFGRPGKPELSFQRPDTTSKP